jgi:hypothetical protein
MRSYPVEHREFLRTVELSSNEAVREGARVTGARSVAQFLAWYEMVKAEERRSYGRQYHAMRRRGEL